MPEFEGRYLEPFFGGGAIFFHLQPDDALISDKNPRLIETYLALRDNHEKVQAELVRYQRQHSKEFYYNERRTVRRKMHTRAAQFIYLNRTCWNGLYRENRRGEFNVPIGTKSKVLLESDNFSALSACLKRAKIEVADFETTVDKSELGDFLFVDPPYTTAHNSNGFVKYNQELFTWEDQVRLRDSLKRAAQRGVHIVLTNADHESIEGLYDGLSTSKRIGRSSVISGNSSGRGATAEALYLFNC